MNTFNSGPRTWGILTLPRQPSLEFWDNSESHAPNLAAGRIPSSATSDATRSWTRQATG
jgi:hypothetical protein